MRHTHWPVVATLVVVALTACTTNDGGARQDEREPTSSGPAPEASPSMTPTPRSRPEPGPLEAYLGLAEVLESPEEVAADVARREALVADCMADQGFEYTPMVPAVDEIEYVDAPLPGTVEFAEEAGYGVWGGANGEGYTWRSATNPNWDRMEGMSEAEKEAYELALWGPVTDTAPDGSVGRDGGCSMTPDEPRGDDAAWLLGVQAEATAFLESLDQDSRLAEVNAAWASCMADAGFTERSPAAAEQRLWDEQKALVTGGTWPEDDVVAQHAEEERRVAMADAQCREATEWTSQYRAIELALQQEYVDAHLADLEALAAALTAPPT